MTVVYIVLVVAVTLQSSTHVQATAATPKCREGEYIISRDETITPSNLVEASDSVINSVISADPAKVLHFGYNDDDLQTWCTDTNDNNPYVIIRFTTPVVITSFLSSGTTDHAFETLDTFHLTNFTLEYSHNNSGDFVYYPSSPNGSEIRFFNQEAALEPVALFRLELPIVTQAVRFRPLQWYDSKKFFNQYICLGVALFGCAAAEAMREQVTTTTMTTTSNNPMSNTPAPALTSTVRVSTPTPTATLLHVSTTTVEVPSTAAEWILIRDYQALEIVLPIALLTITIIIVIVVVGVLLCTKKQKPQVRPHQYDIPLGSPVPLSPGIKILDNSALYSNPNTEETIRSFQNDLYGEDSEIKRAEPDSLEIIYSENQYEFISEKQRSGADGDDDSMEDNSVYLETSSHRVGMTANSVTMPTEKVDVPPSGDKSNGAVEHTAENIYEETMN